MLQKYCSFLITGEFDTENEAADDDVFLSFKNLLEEMGSPQKVNIIQNGGSISNFKNED